MPSIDEVEARSLDVLHAHNTVAEARWRQLNQLAHNLLARGVITLNNDDLGAKPAPQLLADLLVDAIAFSTGGNCRFQTVILVQLTVELTCMPDNRVPLRDLAFRDKCKRCVDICLLCNLLQKSGRVRLRPKHGSNRSQRLLVAMNDAKAPGKRFQVCCRVFSCLIQRPQGEGRCEFLPSLLNESQKPLEVRSNEDVPVCANVLNQNRGKNPGPRDPVGSIIDHGGNPDIWHVQIL